MSIVKEETFLKGGHSSSSSLGETGMSVLNKGALENLYKGKNPTPLQSQNLTVPSSCPVNKSSYVSVSSFSTKTVPPKVGHS